MYYLTLTKKDRDAIDWIGHRYSHGDDLRRVLIPCYVGDLMEDNRFIRRMSYQFEDGSPWDSWEDLTFQVPEHLAWKIAELCREDGMACFSPKLLSKFNDFLNKIV